MEVFVKPFAWAFRYVDKDEGPCEVWGLTGDKQTIDYLRSRDDYEIKELIDACDLLPVKS